MEFLHSIFGFHLLIPTGRCSRMSTGIGKTSEPRLKYRTIIINCKIMRLLRNKFFKHILMHRYVITQDSRTKHLPLKDNRGIFKQIIMILGVHCFALLKRIKVVVVVVYFFHTEISFFAECTVVFTVKKFTLKGFRPTKLKVIYKNS